MFFFVFYSFAGILNPRNYANCDFIYPFSGIFLNFALYGSLLKNIHNMIKKHFLTIIITLVILYLSLAPADNFDKVPINIPYFDKFVHFSMYLALMSVIIFENRKKIRELRQIFILALYPVFLGITLEILQETLAYGRTGSIFDEMANLTGIITSVLLWYLNIIFISN
jgi:hypothetical protein